jgi:hypothetical protein
MLRIYMVCDDVDPEHSMGLQRAAAAQGRLVGTQGTGARRTGTLLEVFITKCKQLRLWASVLRIL